MPITWSFGADHSGRAVAVVAIAEGDIGYHVSLLTGLRNKQHPGYS